MFKTFLHPPWPVEFVVTNKGTEDMVFDVGCGWWSGYVRCNCFFFNSINVYYFYLIITFFFCYISFLYIFIKCVLLLFFFLLSNELNSRTKLFKKLTSNYHYKLTKVTNNGKISFSVTVFLILKIVRFHIQIDENIDWF